MPMMTIAGCGGRNSRGRDLRLYADRQNGQTFFGEEMSMFEALLARTYDRSINRLDLDRTMALWADDAVFEFPGRTSISGRFVGKPAIRDWWRHVFERAREVRFVPRHVAFSNPFLLTFANTMFTELEVDITTKDGLAVHAELVSVIEFRRGKAVHARDYFLDPSVEEQIWGRVPETSAA